MQDVLFYVEPNKNLAWDDSKIGVLILSLQGYTVEVKKNKKGRKIYRFKARINIPPQLLIAAIR